MPIHEKHISLFFVVGGGYMDSNGFTKNHSTALKGIAIIFMVFHHLYCEVSRFENYDVSFWPFNQTFVVNISAMLKICVSIFAFITGYGLLKSISKNPLTRTHIAKWNIVRLLKTMSGFYFVYILTFIVTMLIDGLPLQVYFTGSKTKGLIYIFIDFLGLSALFDTPSLIGTWWYMTAAVIFILLVPFIYFLSKKFGYFPIVAIIVMIPRLLNVGYPGGVNPYSFILPMIFGMIFSEYDLFEKISLIMPQNKFFRYIANFIFWGLSVILCYFITINFKTDQAWELKFAVVPIFIICFCRYCVICIPVVSKVLEFFGKHSMTIFLTHSFIRYTYLNEFIYTRGNFLTIFIVLFVLSLILALVIDFIKQIIRFDNLVNKVIGYISEHYSDTKCC